MASEGLVNAIKQIMALVKGGDNDAANAAYAKLFSSPEFAAERKEDQRQALKLMILAKRQGQPKPSEIESHRAAIAPLTAMVQPAETAEGIDHEMLGLCHLLTGDEAAASAQFRAGLERERATDPQSAVCGRLMTRLSAI